MKFIRSCISVLALGALALPDNLFEKRRAPSCAKYPAANSKLTLCQTNTAYCTRYLGRGPSTTSVYSTTVRKTSTPPVVTVKQTTTTRTFTSTVYTSTSTITAPPFTSTITSSATTSVTQNVTATVTTTKSDTLTISATDTTTQTVNTTTTVPDIPCTPAVLKKRAEVTQAPAPVELEVRVAQTPVPPQCGMTTFPSGTISAACSCLMDRTTTTATTTTITLPRSLTTQVVPTSGTKTVSSVSFTTTTPTVTITRTVFPFTTTVATTTVATTTITPFTTTVATITTTVGTETKLETSTSTTTTLEPRCTDGDRNPYGDSNFVSTCDTYLAGYDIQTVDATDMFDCMSACQTYNDYNLPYSCVGISFNQAQCNQNCELKAAVSGNQTNPDWQSARMLSPAIGEYGNDCLYGAQFGDYYKTAGQSFSVLCGMDTLAYDFGCYNIPPDVPGDAEFYCAAKCVDDFGDDCQATAFFVENTDDYGNTVYRCCPKSAHPASAYREAGRQVDTAVRIN